MSLAASGHAYEVITNGIAAKIIRNIMQQTGMKHLHDKNHLLLELSTLIVLRTYFPVEMKELLELLILGWQHKLDNGHHHGWLHSYKSHSKSSKVFHSLY
jgi:hypothetical protein